ncbi:DUF1385 domain-containing protein [bacterium]|nr:DUF1385 domain-containing protein [bacterium]
MDVSQKIQVGGQAVIEGVMMRSPEYVSVAVRKPDGQIVLKRDRYVSWTKRYRILGLPFFRGGVILIESMVLGIKALNFSSEIAMKELDKDKPKKNKKRSEKLSKLWTGLTVILALALGMGIFFFLPLLLTELTGVKGGVMFNLLDGLIRLIFFIVYLGLISLWKEIRRIFEYHGAEHKSIFAYEEGKPLTLKGVQPFKTHHPRCGTSFLLVVMLVALVVFIILGKPQDMGDRFIRFLFIPIIGGISYEIIRLSGKRFGKWIAQILTAPGLWLQRITTKEPDDKQLEVSLVALKSVLNQKIETKVEMITT